MVACRGEPESASDDPDPATAIPDNPTYAEHVAPLLYESCSACHREGGSAPFTLHTYEDARVRADLLATMTTQRRMPPWLPSATGLRFANERRLRDAEIELLRRWAEQGAPEGDRALTPRPPAFEGGWGLGEPDLIVEMRSPYVVVGGSDEEFRNFVVRASVAGARFVRAVELRPGNARVVHHATVRIDSTDSSRIEDARTPEPGFSEMFTVNEAHPPGGFFLGWTPGLLPRENPAGMAWVLRPGTDFVIQLHLRPVADDESVQAQLGVYFTDEPPVRTPLILRLGSQTMDIPAGEANYVVEDAFRLPIDVDALGIYPHAHYLGHRLEAWAEGTDGSRTELLTIPDWDFDWQDAYDYAAPVALERGTVLHMRYQYDNSSANPQNPSDPPERVVYGPASKDEMAELWLQVVPRRQTELQTLAAELHRKQVNDRIEGWRHTLTVDPEDAHANLGLGNMHQALGEFGQARDRYRLAISTEPNFPQAHYNLGLVLSALGDSEGSISELETAIRLFPQYAAAHNNLGVELAGQGRTREAEEHFERAVEADSTEADAWNNLANMLRGRGALEEAVHQYRRALIAQPDLDLAHLNLSLTLIDLGRPDEAIDVFRRAVPSLGQNPQPYLSMAWALATQPQAPRRRPQVAIQLGEAANELTGGRHALVLDVLATALASAGRFREAVRTGEAARVFALAGENTALVDRIDLHLEQFRQRRVWVEGRD